MRPRHIGPASSSVLGASVVLVLAVAAFYVGRTYSSGGHASAEAPFSPDAVPDTSKANWLRSWREWESEQPKSEKVVAGITVGPETVQTGIPCTFGEARHASPEAAADSLVAIEPRYLPEGVTLQTEEAAECRGQVIWYYRSSSLPVDEEGVARAARGEVPWFDVARGGYVEIFRGIGDPAFRSDIPDYRWEEAEIGGMPTALAHPLIDAGYGRSIAIFHDGQVLTFVRAMNLSLDDLTKVTEGVR
ncbi:MAG: hypothetical protein Kow0010_13210 [Dehalococcoidia bacterium]